jgi:non-ribosomal peptide synthetase component F
MNSPMTNALPDTTTTSPLGVVGRQPLSQLPIGDMLAATSRSYANRACFVSPDGTALTYREVNQRVNRLARTLTAMGLVLERLPATLDATPIRAGVSVNGIWCCSSRPSWLCLASACPTAVASRRCRMLRLLNSPGA